MNATVPIEVDPIHLSDASFADPHAPQAPGRPNLRPVPAPAPERKVKRSPVLGAIIAVGVILGIFAMQLALSIFVSEGAYETRALEIEKRDLARVERVLSQHLDKLSSPQNLADNAVGLGMVQNVHPATLRLSDGQIQGTLETSTRAASDNLVPNSMLATLPVLDAEGLTTTRGQGEAPAVELSAAVRWKGKLPAPETH